VLPEWVDGHLVHRGSPNPVAKASSRPGGRSPRAQAPKVVVLIDTSLATP
jgi:hypothetical protein